MCRWKMIRKLVIIWTNNKQFCWQPSLLSQQLSRKNKRVEAKKNKGLECAAPHRRYYINCTSACHNWTAHIEWTSNILEVRGDQAGHSFLRLFDHWKRPRIKIKNKNIPCVSQVPNSGFQLETKKKFYDEKKCE